MNGPDPRARAVPSCSARGKAELIAFAGLYERWRDQEGGEIDTVVILTCPANRKVSALHDRMPVVLPSEHFEAWLDVKQTTPEAAQKLLLPAPDDLFETIEMHPKINDSKRDEPGIQEPLEPSLL